jgi:hypothetical protein
MGMEVIFEELAVEEKKLLLKAFDYDVNETGIVLSPSGKKLESKESPSKFLSVQDIALVPGSLDIIEGTPTAISEFIRKKVENTDGTEPRSNPR